MTKAVLRMTGETQANKKKCHAERSEASVGGRSFASLRMTKAVLRMTKDVLRMAGKADRRTGW